MLTGEGLDVEFQVERRLVTVMLGVVLVIEIVRAALGM